MIAVYVTNPFDLSVGEYLKIFDNTVRALVLPYRNTAKYKRLTSRILYYGYHSKAPIKVTWNEGDFNMARNYNSIQFVECDLKQSDEKELEKFVTQYKGNMTVLLEDICGSNYTIKIGFYPDQESYACFLAPATDSKENKGKMLSSWSDDPIEAVFMCWYKHKVKLGGGEWDTDTKQKKWG